MSRPRREYSHRHSRAFLLSGLAGSMIPGNFRQPLVLLLAVLLGVWSPALCCCAFSDKRPSVATIPPDPAESHSCCHPTPPAPDPAKPPVSNHERGGLPDECGCDRSQAAHSATVSASVTQVSISDIRMLARSCDATVTSLVLLAFRPVNPTRHPHDSGGFGWDGASLAWAVTLRAQRVLLLT